jgi:hypothetical protein
MKYALLILLLLGQIAYTSETWENDGPIGRDPLHNPLALLKHAGRIDVFLATERVEEHAAPPRVARPEALKISTNPRDWPLAMNIKQGWKISYGYGDFTASKGEAGMITPFLFFTNWRGQVNSLEALWERLTKQHILSSIQKNEKNNTLPAENAFKSISYNFHSRHLGKWK